MSMSKQSNTRYSLTFNVYFAACFYLLAQYAQYRSHKTVLIRQSSKSRESALLGRRLNSNQVNLLLISMSEKLWCQNVQKTCDF